MTRKELCDRVFVVVKTHGPINLRKIEAWLVIDDVGETTFEIFRAVRDLIDSKWLIEDNRFHYTVGNGE